MELARELAEMAKRKGICEEGFIRIASADNIDKLLLYYIEGIDFCLEHDFPTKEFLKEHGRGKLKDYGILINQKIDVKNIQRVVLLDKTSASIKIDNYNASDIYVKHESDLHITVKESAFVSIEAYDSATVNLVLEDRARVYLAIYDKASYQIEKSDNSIIKVVQKGKGVFND